ncbi:methylenetetrahydrofolate dehydrogenase (NADP+)/methenyltetrahydrofolate cyclohydrolase [Scopulibacillus darangshiensis]|uniref:Bifunctional protein FolD n=2 Tax=Scopulibacillus darangshiensis TaxID=442528 RepID=A0A4R2P3X5_9BACL|nr:methylenetetrahydrofolate dehydrogenase (NADP+)/methenyltetrahydrofolate cyclohydrolase [Scopulibacillus darangshiensis]
MEPIILDGTVVAKQIKDGLKGRVENLRAKGITPCLATILVGGDPASETYVRMKGNACSRLGISSKRVHLPKETTTIALLDEINKLNEDPQIHGILLQHPVPGDIDERAAFEAIDLEKDVDGVTSATFGRTALGLSGFPSCTPKAIMTILDYYNITIEGQNAVVIGRSPILGKPVSALLLNRDATITTCHSKTKDIDKIVQNADIVVAAVGKPKFVQGSWIKQGAIILDAGYNEGNIGDVDYDACLTQASAITPVPGGVGPVTIATLLSHTVEAAERSAGKNE